MHLYFNSMAEMVKIAQEANLSIGNIVIKQTAIDMEISETEVKAQMLYQYQVMKNSVIEGMAPNKKSLSGLTGHMASLMDDRNKKGNFSGSFMGEVIAFSLGVIELNACMGKIVAAPTGGSCGIIPGCFIALQNSLALSDDTMLEGLFTASGIGMIIANNASISGAECGCQAECGAAAAMAAGGMVSILGGSPDMVIDGAAHALKGLLGLVCDPVAGLVEEPCVVRNPMSAAVAVTAAEMALAGIKTIIPADEVVEAMKAVGDTMPATLRETAQGGIAVSKTGIQITKELFGN